MDVWRVLRELIKAKPQFAAIQPALIVCGCDGVLWGCFKKSGADHVQASRDLYPAIGADTPMQEKFREIGEWDVVHFHAEPAVIAGFQLSCYQCREVTTYGWGQLVEVAVLLLKSIDVVGAFADQVTLGFVVNLVEATAAQPAQPGLAVGGSVPQIPPGLKAKVNVTVLMQPLCQHQQIATVILRNEVIQRLFHQLSGRQNFTCEGMARRLVAWCRLGFA